jgi:hypothetical protein
VLYLEPTDFGRGDKQRPIPVHEFHGVLGRVCTDGRAVKLSTNLDEQISRGCKCNILGELRIFTSMLQIRVIGGEFKWNIIWEISG